jgi:hypothetical protein
LIYQFLPRSAVQSNAREIGPIMYSASGIELIGRREKGLPNSFPCLTKKLKEFWQRFGLGDDHGQLSAAQNRSAAVRTRIESLDYVVIAHPAETAQLVIT